MNYGYPAYGNYNPIQPFATRNDVQGYQPPQAMQAMQPVQAPTQPQQGNPPAFYCRPVASREEALGVPVDFMGSPMFFPDLAHGVIYLKKFNPNTGAADIAEFRVQPQQEQRPAEQTAFAPLDDLLQLKDDLDNLKSEIERLKKPAGKVARKNESDEQ